MTSVKNIPRIIIIITLISLLQSCKQPAPKADYITVSSIFSNNMVLQRNIQIPVWGKATPNHQIRVIFKNQVSETIAGSDSSWRINLKSEPAGGPFVLKIIGTDTIQFNNVMVGEVWVCSGQSNMEMPLADWGKVNNYKYEIAQANYPDIRIVTIPYSTSLIPMENIEINPWEECSPATIENFSALAYFFGRDLYNDLHVPVGLIHSSVGGTPIEAWMPTEYIKQIDEIKPSVPYHERSVENQQTLLAVYNKDISDWENHLAKKIRSVDNKNPDFTNPKFKDSKWKTIMIPNPWENSGLDEFDGVAWLRKTFKVKGRRKAIKNEKYTLSLGRIHDANKTYLNGKLIGKSLTRWGSEVQTYEIPAGIIKNGKNTLAIEITNYEWIGGICGEKEELFLQNSKGEKISLVGQWKIKPVLNFSNFPEYPISPINTDEPAVLFNAKIYPLIPYAIRGWIWYQGENNAYQNPLTYSKTFPLFIKSMREVWGEKDFPFLYVQLANFEKREALPGPSNWAIVRDAQLKALSLPNTGMAVAIDIGSGDDIHPKNKQEAGRRLAIIALNQIYGKKDIEYTAPVYKSITVDGDTIKLSFSNPEIGLKTSDGKPPKPFSIAGDDKKFKWAETKIVGNRIYVWSKEVPSPKAVRYGWADNPDCNLTGKNNLPVSPFRTDNWKLTIIK